MLPILLIDTNSVGICILHNEREAIIPTDLEKRGVNRGSDGSPSLAIEKHADKHSGKVCKTTCYVVECWND